MTTLWQIIADWWYLWAMLALTLILLAIAEWWSAGHDDDIDDLIRWEEEHWQ